MRIATAFYDKYGTLAAVPDHISNPHNEQDTVDGFPVVPMEYSSDVTIDPGYYHRFAMTYPSDKARSRAAADLLEILNKYNTTVLVDNSDDFYFELDLDMYDQYVKNNIPIPRPGMRYALDVIYLIEDGIRPPFHTLPGRHVDQDSVSDWIDHDPIATSRGWEAIPDPAAAYPDLAQGYFQSPQAMRTNTAARRTSTPNEYYAAY